MKTYKYILFAIAILCGFTACQKDDDVTISNIQLSTNVSVHYNTAEIRCSILSAKATVSYFEAQISRNASFSSYSFRGMGKDGSNYVVNFADLEPGTKYYVRFRAENRYTSMLCKETISFTTDYPNGPTLSDFGVDDIKETSAHVYCSIIDDGGSDVYDRGFYYKRSAANSWTRVQRGTGTGFFDATLSLVENTEYQVYAYATNNYGEGTSSVITFTTLSVPKVPTVTTSAIGDVMMYSAILGGEVTNDGGEVVTEHGVLYSTSSTGLTINNATRVMMGAGKGSFSQTVTGLEANTTYYVRAYAINNIGVAYGDTYNFTTQVAPSVATYTNPEVTATSASVMGSVENGTGDRGICYSFTPNPTIEDGVVYNGTGSGSYTCTLTGLHSGTTYYARAFSSSSYGVTYGNEIEFTTLTTDPVVYTTSVTSVGSYSATVNCEVASDGGHTIIERGVCFNTSGTPTISDTKMANGVGIGTYSCELTGLAYGTTYYVRAYATTAEGTVYGTTRSFTTY